MTLPRTLLILLNGYLLLHVYAIRVPLEKHYITKDARSSHLRKGLQPRDTRNGTIPLLNTQNFVYTGTVQVGGTPYNLQIDTGSADLWVSGQTPASASDTGTSVTIHYGLGQAAGNVNIGTASFAGYNVSNQAFLYVNDPSSIPFPKGIVGIAGIGPSSGSLIQNSLSAPKGEAFLDQIFNLNGSSSNFVTFLMSRVNDTFNTTLSGPTQSELTIEEVLPTYASVTSQPKLPVTIVKHPVLDVQHFSLALNSITGPDGKKVDFASQSLGAPSGESIAVLDSGTSLAYVTRAVSDAIYGRVKRAEYDVNQGLWLVPCEQELNVTLVFDNGVKIPLHPLDLVVDQDLTFSNGKKACAGAIAPNTNPSPEFDHLMGDTVMRNIYTLMNYGDFITPSASSSKADPFMQLLPLTDPAQAHKEFVNDRLKGVDTTGDPSYALEAKGQTSPSTPGEKAQQTLGFFQQHRTLAIIIGIAIICGLFALLTCLCCFCCRGPSRLLRSKNKAASPGQPNYRDPGVPSIPVFQPSWGYRGVHDPSSAPGEGGAVPLEDMEHGMASPRPGAAGFGDNTQGSRLSNPFRDSYRPSSMVASYAPPSGPPPPLSGGRGDYAPVGTGGGHSREPSVAEGGGRSPYRDPFSDSHLGRHSPPSPTPSGAPPRYGS